MYNDAKREKTNVGMDCLKREYPTKPIVGVGAVVACNGEILLVQRGSEPGKNEWSIPGGIVELGETVKEATVRDKRRN